MSLTRKLLREHQLDDSAIETIISAHMETVQAIARQRDDALAQARQSAEETSGLQAQLADLSQVREDAEALRQEYASYRDEVENARTEHLRHAALRNALLDAGANPEAVELLIPAVDSTRIEWEEERIANAPALIAPLRARHSGLFARTVPLPLPRIAPPGSAQGPLTRADISRMSEQEILTHWNIVQNALSKGV